MSSVSGSIRNQASKRTRTPGRLAYQSLHLLTAAFRFTRQRLSLLALEYAPPRGVPLSPKLESSRVEVRTNTVLLEVLVTSFQ